MGRTYDDYKEENKRQLDEDRISDLIGLTDYQKRIEEIEEEIEDVYRMDLEELREEYGVDVLYEALNILQMRLEETEQELEDFINENKNDDDYE